MRGKLKYPLVACGRHGDPLPGFAVCSHVLQGAPVAVRQEPSSTQLGAIACAVCREDHTLFGRVAKLSCARCVADTFGGPPPPPPTILHNPATYLSKHKTVYREGDRVVSVTARNMIGSKGTVIDASIQEYGEIRIRFDHVGGEFWVHTSDFRKEHQMNPIAQNPSRRKRTVVFTYDVVSEESASEGETAEDGFYEPGGYYNARNDVIGPAVAEIPGAEGTPVSGADEAIHLITDELGGYLEASSTQFHPGVWYTQSDSEQDMQTGDYTTLSAHLHGFSPREEYWVWQQLMTGRRWRTARRP